MTQQPASITTLSFEAALEELEQIVKNLENGKTSLEDSIASYERGIALKDHCEARLRDARMKIEKIVAGQDGAAQGTRPLDE